MATTAALNPSTVIAITTALTTVATAISIAIVSTATASLRSCIIGERHRGDVLLGTTGRFTALKVTTTTGGRLFTGPRRVLVERRLGTTTALKVVISTTATSIASAIPLALLVVQCDLYHFGVQLSVRF